MDVAKPVLTVEYGDSRAANGTVVVPKSGFQCEKALTVTSWRVKTYSIEEKTCRKREVYRNPEQSQQCLKGRQLYFKELKLLLVISRDSLSWHPHFVIDLKISHHLLAPVNPFDFFFFELQVSPVTRLVGIYWFSVFESKRLDWSLGGPVLTGRCLVVCFKENPAFQEMHVDPFWEWRPYTAHLHIMLA